MDDRVVRVACSYHDGVGCELQVAVLIDGGGIVIREGHVLTGCKLDVARVPKMDVGGFTAHGVISLGQLTSDGA